MTSEIVIKQCIDCKTNKNINDFYKGKNTCKECRNTKYKCPHGKRKSRCKECGGKSICEHNKEKSYCKDCRGSSYCIHNKGKSRCKDCGGSAICDHNKQKSYCIECNPSCACQLCKSKFVSKTTRFYPLCEACFSFTYPDSKLVTAYKIKERYLCDELKERFKGIDISLTLDKRVDGGCSLRKPDVFIDVLTHSIIIECDEYQHKNYECENKRTMELFRDLGNRPLVLIRFNPDSYIRKNKERENGCFKPLIDIEDIHRKKFYNIVKEEWNRRIETLIPIVKEYMELRTFPDKEITIIHLFYNNFD